MMTSFYSYGKEIELKGDEYFSGQMLILNSLLRRQNFILPVSQACGINHHELLSKGMAGKNDHLASMCCWDFYNSGP